MSEREEIVQEGFATVDDTAKFLRVGRSTVYTLMENGQLAYAKIRRSRRIPWNAIRQFAAESMLASGGTEVAIGEQRNA